LPSEKGKKIKKTGRLVLNRGAKGGVAGTREKAFCRMGVGGHLGTWKAGGKGKGAAPAVGSRKGKKVGTNAGTIRGGRKHKSRS